MIEQAEKDMRAYYKSKVEEYVDTIKLILPMAKGYAYKNQVGSNMKYIKTATQAIHNFHQSEGG